MGLFNRTRRTNEGENPRTWPPVKLELPEQTTIEPTSYIEIYESKKGNCHLRIKGGNNKIRFHSENYYSHVNAVRAARLFSKETGLTVVDRTKA